MRILIVTDSYPPEVRSAAQLMVELAEGLQGRGHEIIVATTVPGYNLSPGTKPENISRDEIINGVRVIRVPTLPHHRVPYIIRGINQILLPTIFIRAVRKMISGPIARVIVHSPPLPLALAAAKIARLYRARFIANIHDIFPQNGIDLVSFWQKPLIQFFFGRMERFVYRAADIIVVPSENHAKYLISKRGVPAEKFRVIPHWVNIASFSQGSGNRFRKKWNLEKKFIFFFGGVLGPSQGLDMVINAAEALRAVSDAIFLFVGDGTDKSRIQSITRKRKLENVLFKPFVSGVEYTELVQEMNVGVVTLTSKNTTPAVPAKLMGYMAGGIPVIVTVHKESDALRIVNEAKCGFTAVSNDREAVIAAFRAAYDSRNSLKTLGENGLRYAREHFNRDRCVDMWETVLQS